jgi:hypothetical protein
MESLLPHANIANVRVTPKLDQIYNKAEKLKKAKSRLKFYKKKTDEEG